MRVKNVIKIFVDILLTVILLLLMAYVFIGYLFNSVENDVIKAADTYLLLTECSFPFLQIYDSWHSMVIFRLGIAYLFGIIFNMGIFGVWIAMITDWSARSVSFILRFKGEKWKRYRAT